MTRENPQIMQLLKDRKYLADGETKIGHMFKRVADYVGNNSTERKEFFEMMNNKLFIPNTPALVNAGRSNQLAACFGIPIKDNVESIYVAVYESAIIGKEGGRSRI